MDPNLDNRNILKVINEFEASYDLSSIKANNFNIWPIVRIAICFGLISKRYSGDTFLKQKKSKKSAFASFIAYRSFLSMNKQEINIQTLDVTHDIYLYKINEIFFDRVHFESKIEKNDDYLKKRFNLADFTLRDKTHNKVEMDFFQAVRLYKLLSLPYTLLVILKNIEILKHLLNLHVFFRSKSINSISILIKIPFKVSYAILLSKFGKFFFKRSTVKFLRHANYYSLESMALTLAARECGIKVSHVQHGSQSDDHPAFGKWNNISSQGYDLLPEVFECWDQQSMEVIKRSFGSHAHHYANLNGYKWVDAWKKGEIPFNTNELKMFAKNKFNILITLQPSINGVQDFVKDCINESSDNIRWWIRLHPRQLTDVAINEITKTFKNKIKSEAVIVNLASTSPLPSILSVTDLHITAFSSSIFEASYFDIPTIITHKMGLDYYGSDLDSLNGSFCNNSTCIKKKIEDGVNSKF
jgi:hypothetical protein